MYGQRGHLLVFLATVEAVIHCAKHLSAIYLHSKPTEKSMCKQISTNPRLCVTHPALKRLFPVQATYVYCIKLKGQGHVWQQALCRNCKPA